MGKRVLRREHEDEDLRLKDYTFKRPWSWSMHGLMVPVEVEACLEEGWQRRLSCHCTGPAVLLRLLWCTEAIERLGLVGVANGSRYWAS